MKSITVRVIGGLGNQMHCYAFGRALAFQSGAILKLDAESGYWRDPFGRVFWLNRFPRLNACVSATQPKSEWAHKLSRLGLKLKIFCSRFLPLTMKMVIREEETLCYKEDVHHARYMTNPYFIGYWASYRYYQGIEKELRQELKPPKPNNQAFHEMLSQVKSVRSCFIHWRSYKEDQSLEYPDLGSYYREAVNLVSEKYQDIVFFIFSDDPVGAKNLITSSDNGVVYVDLPDAQGDIQSLADFYLMYSCDHAIIGNSTFSWWAAWLGDSDDKTVVAPGGVSPWGDDWLPPHWVALDIKGSRK